jgi:uncharacterized paraquat-inducible protein A
MSYGVGRRRRRTCAGCGTVVSAVHMLDAASGCCPDCCFLLLHEPDKTLERDFPKVYAAREAARRRIEGEAS